ncbi:Hypothetical_protein [Hexamita inflata]|uniref:Hypothetical_protein n=1 Tax=Hexamita inflata TaxID=28002 RepID=A0ABP1GWZ0_9EUKA
MYCKQYHLHPRFINCCFEFKKLSDNPKQLKLHVHLYKCRYNLVFSASCSHICCRNALFNLSCTDNNGWKIFSQIRIEKCRLSTRLRYIIISLSILIMKQNGEDFRTTNIIYNVSGSTRYFAVELTWNSLKFLKLETCQKWRMNHQQNRFVTICRSL